jgi:hypothetical protein
VTTYTDYSSDPDSNNADPPVGAPEGQFRGHLVNNIMREMMSVIRKLGDMALKMPDPDNPFGPAGTMATQDANAVEITGGRIRDTAGVVPIRTIIPWYGTLANAALQEDYGWAICDGRRVNGFLTPDLRGLYLKGWTNSLAPQDEGGSSEATTDGPSSTVTASGAVSGNSKDVASPTHNHDVTFDPPHMRVIFLMRVR